VRDTIEREIVALDVEKIDFDDKELLKKLISLPLNRIHWSSVKDFELLNSSFFHTNYALHKRDPISIMACCNLFDQANLAGLATEITATLRFLS